jgi:hypothetical protein
VAHFEVLSKHSSAGKEEIMKSADEQKRVPGASHTHIYQLGLMW